MEIAERLEKMKRDIPNSVQLVAVSKTHPLSAVQEAYDAGQRDFGENKVQELVGKADVLPKDIKWHLIGHLQTNKVKYIAPVVYLIHSVDSLKLLKEIDKQAKKVSRVIKCLLQVYIAQEDTKYGLSFDEAETLILDQETHALHNVELVGLMGMASFTENEEQVRKEFNSLHVFSIKMKDLKTPNWHPSVLSMGMSGDYKIAIEEGSTMIRVGSNIFGTRNYPQVG